VAAATEHPLTELEAFGRQVAGCTKCRLSQGRTQVVFGVGDPDADLMFVGEAPGFHEDKQGYPFVGQAGKLLDKLLAEIGLERKEVWICNVLKCRPPDNRDPHPNEIESCREYLLSQVELIEPVVICTLGNFSTKLLRADTTGISRLHGQAETRIIGARAVRLYPLFHPAAALYTPSMLETLRTDFQRLPDLLALGPPQQPQLVEAPPEPEFEPEAEAFEPEAPPDAAEPVPAAQLGLF
jgi:uracil-DNA glycosylase